MCNFNNQSKTTKEYLHAILTKGAQHIGGVNFLLSLIEALRGKKPHPLITKEMQVASNNSIIQWNKVIFKDKVDLIEYILIAHKDAQENDYNILNEPNKKKKKNIINMVKTLSPVEFIVTPQNPNDGNGFSFGVFETIDFANDIVKFNPIFIAIFFCGVGFTKSALKYSE